ncbi:MAG: uroporphyrinogen decarboxylase [Verrucomicrobiales bacterium]|nr:uroporphyrinogen decarboxylase [Verrucomicrobiales bacterium]
MRARNVKNSPNGVQQFAHDSFNFSSHMTSAPVLKSSTNNNAKVANESFGELTSRDRFLRACNCLPVDRPPVWLMRQAGRCLPEYRALKEKHTFVELVQSPELATEVTLQPIRRFNFDAAILFSDILVIAEALGQSYRFGEKGGIEMDFLLKSAGDIDQLSVEAVSERLQYEVKALQLIKKALNGKNALIGFAGSPWTLANYMLEGSAKEFTKAKALFYSDHALFCRLLQKITDAVTIFLKMQIDAGADVVQIFDSNGGVLSDSMFDAASGQWMQQIVAALKKEVPVTVFSRGSNGSWDSLVRTGANVLSVDWTMNLRAVRDSLPANVGVQGNLDPFLLNTNPQVVAAESNRLLNQMRGAHGFIFNLGHGVPPTSTLENIEALVTTVRNFK